MKDIRVLKAERYDNDSVSQVIQGVSGYTETIAGQSNLAHRVLKIMLTERGSNLYYPELGTNIARVKSSLTSSSTQQEAQTIFKQVVDQTEKQIKRTQNEISNLSLSELLDKIEIINILFNEDTNRWKFRIAIYNQDSQISILEI